MASRCQAEAEVVNNTNNDDELKVEAKQVMFMSRRDVEPGWVGLNDQ